MKKKILLPTDFSACSWNAISYALELFKNDTCEFFILNAFKSNNYSLSNMMVAEPGDTLFDTSEKESEEGLDKIKKQIEATKGFNTNHQFKFIASFNYALDAIKYFVDKYEIDMVVMGSKGVSDSENIIYGSVAVDAMEKIRSCPVLTIPKNAEVELPKEIVFPTDFNMPIYKEELSNLAEIAKKTNAEVRILHVVKNLNDQILDNDQKYNKSLIEKYLENVKCIFHTIEGDNTVSTINDYVKSRESDMVVFINKKHWFFGSFLTRPFVKTSTKNLDTPVMALHY